MWAAVFWAASSPVVAQIVPDATLPTNSIVTPNSNTLTIDGGTAAGGNLFHSFREFSLPTGSEAFFNNAPTINNIITRVTGGQISNIDGLIRANGKASLFLINPSGIIFGSNAKLDIGGSFIGSTADSIRFADGSIFSATNVNAPPLLTINVPVGLQYRSNPGEIRVQGTGHSFIQPNLLPLQRGNSTSGLRVKPGNTIALVGGGITLDGGVLTAESGRIELGSVADGRVDISPTATGWTLGYGSVQNYRDITLLSKAGVDASGAPGGSIQIQGRNLELRDSSTVLIQNQGSQPGGDIVVNLSETLTGVGSVPDGSPPSVLLNSTVGSGDGGNIRVTARNLVFRDGAQITAATYASGASGDAIATIADSVLLAGFSLDRNGQPFISSILTLSSGSSGKLGDIQLLARRLTVLDGGAVSTFNVGTGDGGNVEVNAAESVELIGFSPALLGSSVSTTTFNAGKAGDVIINTPRLAIRDGGRVDASTLARGNAGNVTLNVRDSVEISGTISAPQLSSPSSISSAANAPTPVLQQFLGLPPIPSGSPGNVTINTPVLRVSDGALVTVQNAGTGNAGNLQIRANSIFLNSGGGITASTASGEGGNLSLQVRSLQLRNNSQINAEAGGSGNGGNITLNADTLAVLQNSRLNANAFLGAGGNISINTQGIYVAPNSRITASSQLGVAGVVQITNPEVNPSSGLINLPETVTDPSDQVIVGCAATQGNSFTITGRGGVPEDPTATIRGGIVWQDLQDFALETEQRNTPIPSSQPKSPNPPDQIVEATGWIVNAQGKVELVAQYPTGNRSLSRYPECTNY